MPDDYDGDGAPPSGPGGKRRAPDPADSPRRRRRSLDDDGGVSVSDLVERHSASRADLPAPGRRRADESRHAAPEPERPRRGGIDDLGAAMQGRRAAAEQAEPAPGRHGRRRAPEQQAGRMPDAPRRSPGDALQPQAHRDDAPPVHRDGGQPGPSRQQPPAYRDDVPPVHRDGGHARQQPPAHRDDVPPVHREGRPARPIARHQPPAYRDDVAPAHRDGGQPGRPDARHQSPLHRDGAPGDVPPVHREGVRHQPPAHRDAAAQPVDPEAPRRRPAPRGQASAPLLPPVVEPGGAQRASVPADVVRQATGAHRIPADAGLDFDQYVPAEPPRPPAPPARALPEPTRTGDLPEDDRPSKYYPVPARHEPFPRDRHEPPADDRNFPVDRRVAEPPLAVDHDPRRQPGPAAEPRPSGRHPLPRPARPGDDRPAGRPLPPPTGAHPVPPADPPFGDAPRRQPTGQFPVDGDPEFADGPRSGRRQPTGQFPVGGDEDFDAPHPGRRRQAGPRPAPVEDPAAPPPGRRPHPAAAEDPAFAEGPRPGRRQPTGQHPLHADDPAFPDAPRPGRRQPTGQFPVDGDPEFADGPRPGRRQPTGQHPVPAEGPAGPRRPVPVDDPSPVDAPPPGRRQPTGQHPIAADPRPYPPHEPQRPAPADEPVDGPRRRPHPPGPHPARPVDGPQPSGRFPVDGPARPGRPQPTGALPLPDVDGPRRPPNPPQPDGPHEVFPDDRPPFPEAPQPSGRFPVDAGADTAARPGGDGKPRIPRQQPPGESSMPNAAHPEETQKVGLTPPPGVSEADAVGLTTEMEPVGEATQKRRRVDETLARFSKVHDELKAEERAKRAKRRLPWSAEDDELEEQLEELAKPPGETGSTDEKPKPKKRGLIARVFAGTTAILVFTATGVGWGFLKYTGDSIGKVRALDPESAAIQNAEGQRGDENFLLVGSDTREGAEAEEGVGDASQVPGARADTTMIAHVPADRSRVVIVSFPRDLEIQRPECERFDPKTNEYTGETVAGQQAAKLNTAYQVGGPLCATRVVQELSGLRITRFIGIDFHGFKHMVDAVDGVTVCVEEPMYDTFMKKWIVRQAGKEVELRGDQALDFVRARHVRGDPTSDYGRIKRQQRFLSSLLRKSMSGQVLLDPGKLTSFTQAFANATFGDNITVESLFSLGQSLQGLEAGRVTFLTVPTVGIANERGNEELRVEDNAALFRAIVNNQPLPGEAPAERSDNVQRALPQSSPLRARMQQVDPKTLKVQVLNGGNTTSRMAARTGDKLAEYGYEIVLVNSAPKVAHTVIYYGTGNEAAARTLASSIPGVHLKADPSVGKALVLVIGPEYDGEVVAPGTAEVAEPEPEKLPEDLSAINGDDVECA